LYGNKEGRVSEIKSSLELALEKTKGIKTTQEEREQIKKQEYLSQATSLLSKYLSGEDRIEDVKKVLEKDEPLTKEFLALLWTKITMISDVNQRVLEAISHFQKNGETLAIKIEGLQKEYERVREEKLNGMEKTILARLAEKGIRGSAIVPNPSGSKEGMELLDILENEYSGKLQEIIKAVI
jgi:hypothetical protein